VPRGSIARIWRVSRNWFTASNQASSPEHLSWSVVDGQYLADLLPLPMTEEALEVVCRHVQQTQEISSVKS